MTDVTSIPRLTRRDALTLGIAGASFAFVPAAAARPRDLDADIRGEMAAGHLPGLSVAVVRSDGGTWSRGYGWANIAHRRRATRNTEFMLASVSKTVVGVAVMQAVEAGLLDLDGDVEDVVAFPVRNPEYRDAPITLRMLLTHTSTIADAWDVLDRLYAEGDSPLALGTFLERYFMPGARWYARRENWLSSRPGERYRYSNVGIALAAYAVEAASGMSFDRWCDRRIFEPLGMDEASWHFRGMRREDVAMPYVWDRTRDRYRATGQYGYPDYPDGQLRASAVSLSRFLLAFVRGGELDGIRILEEQTVRQMRSNQVPDEYPGQGLIWYVLHRHGERYWGHDGGDTGVATTMFFRPTDGVGVVTLANGDWRWDRGWPLMRIVDRIFHEADGLV